MPGSDSALSVRKAGRRIPHPIRLVTKAEPIRNGSRTSCRSLVLIEVSNGERRNFQQGKRLSISIARSCHAALYGVKKGHQTVDTGSFHHMSCSGKHCVEIDVVSSNTPARCIFVCPGSFYTSLRIESFHPLRSIAVMQGLRSPWA